MPRCHVLSLPLLCLYLLPLEGSASPQAPTSFELGDFSGLKSLFRRTVDSLDGNTQRDCNARFQREFLERPGKMDVERTRRISEWQQFQLVAARVLGKEQAPTYLTYARACAAFLNGSDVLIRAPRSAMKVDRFVERMLILGYTPRELTDVVTGRITLHAFQQAQNMRALGYTSKTVNAYLDRHYRGPRAKRTGADVTASKAVLHEAPVTRNRKPSARARLKSIVIRYAQRYNIDPNLVCAVIANESSWRTQAQSEAGAIGLMQLMPTTARMLGVDPSNPEQNIEGGVRYLAGLLKIFKGDVDAALVAYNAGPTHARKWRKGGTVLYGETRTYLKRVKNSYTSRSF